jgi:uncharacterized membrane protein YgcG
VGEINRQRPITEPLGVLLLLLLPPGECILEKGRRHELQARPSTHVVVVSTVHAYSQLMCCMQQSHLLNSIREQQRRMHQLAPTARFAWAAAACAASSPGAPGASHSHATYTPAVTLAAEVVSKALQGNWGSVEDARLLRQMVEGLSGRAAVEAVMQAAVAAGKLQAGPEFAPPCVVGDLLQALEPVGGVLLQLWHKQHQAGQQCAALSGGSSSSSSTGRSSSRGSLQAEAYSSDAQVDKALTHVLRCFLFLGSFSISSPVAAFKQQDAFTWFPASIAAWSQHTAQLCKLFESATRLGISAGVRLNPAESILDTLLGVAARGFLCLPEPNGTGAYLQGALAAEPGSRQQKQLLSLLFTCLKVPARLPVSQYLKAQELRLSAALAAAAAMHRLTAAAVAEEEAGSNSSSSGCSCTCTGAGSSNSGSGNSNGGSSAGCQTAGKGLLPWLALLGRCCRQWSQLLQCEQDPGVSSKCGSSPSAGPNLPRYLGLRCTADIFLMPPTSKFWPWQAPPPPSMWSLMYTACLLCLKTPAVAAQMRSAGVDAGALLELLRDTSDVVQEARRASSTGAWAGSNAGMLAQQLRRLGEGFASIAIPSACNNPHCADLSAKTETAAVSGKGSSCGGCRVAHFCSRGGLTSHWRLHKPVCRALEASATTAAAAAPGDGGDAAL